MEKKYQIFPLYFIIIVVTFSVFAATLGYDFLGTWDDGAYIEENPFVQGITWTNITAIFSRFFVGNYAPLHLLSYMVDHAIWGMNPLGFRLTNLLLHTLGTLFLFFLLKKITNRQDVSLGSALIFAIHPVQVETVAWISQRKSLLAFVLFLPALYCYLSYSKSKSRTAYWASVMFYTLSLLSKVSTITLPLLLLLYDFSFGKKIDKKNLMDKLPYFIVAGCISLVAIHSQTSTRPEFFYDGSPFITMLIAVEVLARYIGHLFFPVHLAAYYYPFLAPLPDPTLLLSALLLLLLLWGTFVLFRKDRKLGFWAVWFFVVFLPNMNIVPLPVAMADRYLYIPLIGPAVLFCYLIFGPTRKNLSMFSGNWFPYGILLIVLCLLGSLSHAKTRVWKDDISLWTDTVKTAPHGVPYTNLGNAYLKTGQMEKAKACFERAAEVSPELDISFQNLGNFALVEKDPVKAEYYLKKAVAIKPDNEKTQLLLAAAYVKKDELSSAINSLRNALLYFPDSLKLNKMLVQLLNWSNQPLEALPLCKKLIEQVPQDTGIQLDYSIALLKAGHTDQAERALKKAISMNGEVPGPYYFLGVLYEKTGQYELSAEYYEIGLTKADNASKIMNDLSCLYTKHFPGKIDRAIELAEKAVSLAPNGPHFLDTLCWAYFNKGEFNRAAELCRQALKIKPENPNFLFHTGSALLKSGEYIKGKQHLTRLIDKYPDHELIGKAKTILEKAGN